MPPKEPEKIKRTRKRALPKRLSRDEAEAVLNVPNRNAITGLRNRCMMELMYRAGLRVSEVSSLEIRDLNIKKRTVTVIEGKYGVDRITAYPEGKIDAYLEEWLRRRKKETFNRQRGSRGGEYLFTTIQGAPVSIPYIQQMVRRCAKKAKIEGIRVHPHIFRHTFASEFLEGGGQVHQLQMLLGHKHLSTTQIYMHLSPEDAIAALQRIGRRSLIQ